MSSSDAHDTRVSFLFIFFFISSSLFQNEHPSPYPPSSSNRHPFINAASHGHRTSCRALSPGLSSVSSHSNKPSSSINSCSSHLSLFFAHTSVVSHSLYWTHYLYPVTMASPRVLTFCTRSALGWLEIISPNLRDS